MVDPGRKTHWENVYATKGEREVSWFEESPELSLELIRAAGATPRSAVIDIGGGASRLVDVLLAQGFASITVLDLAQTALAVAQRRLGNAAGKVTWVAADITQWQPPRRYDLWHDRAVFHFLTEAADRAAYVEALRQALVPGGKAIIGTFAPEGPERCSGLDVVRYDGAALAATLSTSFALIDTRRHAHHTPSGSVQHFQFSLFERV